MYVVSNCAAGLVKPLLTNRAEGFVENQSAQVAIPQ